MYIEINGHKRYSQIAVLDHDGEIVEEVRVKNANLDDFAQQYAGSQAALEATSNHFQRIRDICDEYDILLISDEVINGFGRCGEWFGIETEDDVLDMITFAKGVTGAYAPLAGVITRPAIGDQLTEEGMALGQTFGGHPVACAAGVAAVDEYADKVLDNVRENEVVFEEKLGKLGRSHDVVNAIHGRRYHWSVESADPETGDPFFDPRVDSGENPIKTVIEYSREDGVLVGSGRPATQISLCPPLIADADELRAGIDCVDQAIRAVFD